MEMEYGKKTSFFYFLMFNTVVNCHLHHKDIYKEISHKDASTYLREKRGTGICYDEPLCEANKPICQNANENVRESYCTGHSCPIGQTCFLSTPCPAHYELGCIDDPCQSFPCKHDGTCTKISGSTYQCNCKSGYNPSTDCAEINECNSNPCQNGATCVDHLNSYSCTCSPGYKGTNCETEINECDSNPCQNGASCVDHVNSYSCTCVAGYSGTNCEADINECSSNPCLNGATCNDHLNSYSCSCSPGYDGVNCGTDINECSSNPCLNGATCNDHLNNYSCSCLPGYNGVNCETDINECDSNPCQNGASCVDHVNNYSCTCVAGYSGTNCESDINECSSNPCLNGATCNDHLNSYSCSCLPGFNGVDCGRDINECNSNPCENGASCVDHVNSYSCTCVAGYSGTDCETDINECGSNPCQNGATCVDHVNSFSCTCVAGYSGLLCETDVNECSSNPCENGATCNNLLNRYSCTCIPGFAGTNCETNINECSSNPCNNGATCVDHVNRYSCTCVAGYSGTTCETDINECASSPCQNGGTCTDHVNRYSCTCLAGYSGLSCETDIDECYSSPCQNNGRCQDLVNAYNCDCTARYNGTVCEKDCRPGPADILFIIDTSNSADVNKSRDFISKFINRIPIGVDDFQVSVLTFSWNASLQFSFNQYANNASLIDAISKIAWEGGPTFVREALSTAATVMTDTTNGRRLSVQHYIVLITDGMSTDRQNALTQAQIMAAHNFRIMAVGLGRVICHEQLLQIVSDANDLFSPDNDDLLNTILKETSHADCTDCTQHTDTDVLFLMEKAMNGGDTSKSMTVMQKTASYFNLGTNNIHIGMMSYDNSVGNHFSLSQQSDYRVLNNALSKLTTRNGESNTTNALKFARQNGFDMLNGGRQDSRKILVVIANSDWSDLSTVQGELEALKVERYRVFLVISKPIENFDEAIFRILPETFGLIYAGESDFFSSLQSIATEATYYSCASDTFQMRV